MRFDHVGSINQNGSREVQRVPQPCCLKKERERHCHPTARAPQVKAFFIKETDSGAASVVTKANGSSMKNPKKFNAFVALA